MTPAEETVRILVVCAANRGRSPIVEELLRGKLDALGLRFTVELSSAGICATELGCVGLPAEDTCARVAREHGLDLSAHRARALTLEMVAESSLTIVMEAWQEKLLVTALPRAAATTCRLHHLAGDDRDAPDIARVPEASVRRFVAEADESVSASLRDGMLGELVGAGLSAKG